MHGSSLIVDEVSTAVSPSQSKAVLERGFARTIQALQAEGVRVWVLAQVPLQPDAPTRHLVYAAWWGRHPPTGVSIVNHQTRQANVAEVLRSFDSQDVQVLDPTPYCFDSAGNSRIGDTEFCFYSDDDHLSNVGAEILLSSTARSPPIRLPCEPLNGMGYFSTHRYPTLRFSLRPRRGASRMIVRLWYSPEDP